MNKKEKQWIKENLEKIFIEDINTECDSQADDILSFLTELAGYVDARLVPDEK